MRNYPLLILLLILTSCKQGKPQQSETSILISNISVLDVKTGDIQNNLNIVIDSGFIKSVSTAEIDKTLFKTHIDGKGNYLMPGLAEMHAHIPPPSTSKERIEETLFLYLSNGITTIRGMLGHPEHLQLRKASEEQELLSPRIFTSSPSLNGNTVKTKEEASLKVRQYQKDGYDFLKIHPGIELEVFDEIVKTARETGISFSGHVPVKVGIRHALESRYASIDHIDGFLEGLVPQSANVNPEENGFFGYNFTPLADTEMIPVLSANARANKVWIVPTQSLFERWFAPVEADVLLAETEMRYMPKSTLDEWKKRKNASTGIGSGFNEEQWQTFINIRRELLRSLQKDGHGILLGSDAPQLFNVPGFSIHHEISSMTKAGLTPLQIIQSGTIAPARFLEQEELFGEVKKGQYADLILLEANPLEDLSALKNPKGVFSQGRWLSRSMIKKKLDQIAKNTENQ
ncbi:amidohydrolase family protein [Eudoraea chungangensis]|uniref:amidohydrolase family protein n=1 Tax=Eudoraea chungangensis TaxID=1481905 RepID=UPI0023EC8746|nr:amidohydrolase family protein [Eudoraea chungangensis]